MKIEFFGHSFFRISFGKTVVLVDPFINPGSGGNSMKRLVGCPVSADKIKKVDAILVSNESFDHFDAKTAGFLSVRNNCAVVSHDSILSGLAIPNHLKKPVRSNDSFSLRGIDFEVLPAHCPSYFSPFGFLLKKDEQSVFFAGDTALTESFVGVKSDVALLPIGGSITMDVIDAVKATKSIKPDYVVPMHYNTFDHIRADPNDFKSRIEKSVLKTKPVILKPGQSFIV